MNRFYRQALGTEHDGINELSNDRRQTLRASTTVSTASRSHDAANNGTSRSRLLFPHPLPIACKPSHLRLNLLMTPHRTFLINQRCVLFHRQ